jgi:DNA-directed RNA polymerase specialized sigma24 family protein
VGGPQRDDEVELKDVTPDTHVPAPDAEAADHDLVQYLHGVSQDWPREERAVFELHFLEGFETDEVAMLEKLPLKDIPPLVERVQLRLREALTEAVQTKGSAHPATLGLTNRPKGGK